MGKSLPLARVITASCVLIETCSYWLGRIVQNGLQAHLFKCIFSTENCLSAVGAVPYAMSCKLNTNQIRSQQPSYRISRLNGRIDRMKCLSIEVVEWFISKIRKPFILSVMFCPHPLTILVHVRSPCKHMKVFIQNRCHA
jgi:hypothetical protein